MQSAKDVADKLLEQLSVSDYQYVLEDESAWVDVNDRPSAGFTLCYEGVYYCINVTPRRN